MSEEYWDYCKQEGAKIGLCAEDFSYVLYLRERSRWTQELEDKLIEDLKAGKYIDVNEFGVTEETQQAMRQVVEQARIEAIKKAGFNPEPNPLIRGI